MSIGGLYDHFARHPRRMNLGLLVLTLLLGLLASTLRFSEDISDFLPLDAGRREAMDVYQRISGAENLVILVSGEPERVSEAVGCLEEAILTADTEHWLDGWSARFDMERISRVADFICDNIPYFLTEDDVRRMDSLLAQPSFIPSRLAADRELLMLPSAGMTASRMKKDPLGLFTPVLSRLQDTHAQMHFAFYDGCLFTPDMQQAIVTLRSPFGNSETEHNTRLVALVEGAIRSTLERCPEVEAHLTGGPAIAVGNARQIKRDSILAVSLSAVLIVLLLAYTFHSLRNILLILLSVSWGALFALGGLALLGNRVSIIVIGISSIILGIAVNYPLHLIAHTAHQPDRRQALREIFSPLVIGNITTVGAFLTLVPLKSTALRDLGLFASFLLVGTILFVLTCLPHYIRVRPLRPRRYPWLETLSQFSPERHRGVVLSVVLLTLLFAFFSFDTGFDSNLSNINYMSPRQRADMQYFERLMARDTTRRVQSVYLLSAGATPELALEAHDAHLPLLDSLLASGLVRRCQGPAPLVVSRAEQQRRLDAWNGFVRRHPELWSAGFADAARRCGFSPRAFEDFQSLPERFAQAGPREVAFFDPLTSTVLDGHFARSAAKPVEYVVDRLLVDASAVEAVEAALPGSFDIAGINAEMSSSLSDHFNYIGWACSLIVFFFLWFSFGRLELALISFLPMALSWLWILGLMALTGVKFNIVNVILATFIFGQGDDYTIFITEGCQYEYARRKPILAAYKGSILQSALIMFVGIGTLIVARHPAMRSLAQITIIGMFSVVMMAWMVPPLLFRLMTQKDGRPRRHPLTLRTLLSGAPDDAAGQVRGRYIYKGRVVVRTVRRHLDAFAAALSGKPLPPVYEWEDPGYGELSLLLALTHPGTQVRARIADDERRRIAEVAAEDFVENIQFIA